MDGRLKTNRPKLTSVQLVKKLEKKGVTFKYITRAQAVNFLKTKNNYFRIISYKKNYQKVNGEYQNMDLSYLIELSKLDMYLRDLIMKACIDVEHCLKVGILLDIETNESENGYNIVEEFLSDTKNQYIINDIKRKSTSHYSGDLIKHFFNYQYVNGKLEFDCPVWAFLEMITFGTLIKFYEFYFNKYGNAPITPKILHYVQSLRNACAHNNCILHDLSSNGDTIPISEICSFVSKNQDIGTGARRKKLKNQFILEFSALLYVIYTLLSNDLKKRRIAEFKKFADSRLTENISYYNKNLLVKSSIIFLKKTIDFL